MLLFSLLLFFWTTGNGQGIQAVDEVVWEKAWRVYSKLVSNLLKETIVYSPDHVLVRMNQIRIVEHFKKVNDIKRVANATAHVRSPSVPSDANFKSQICQNAMTRKLKLKKQTECCREDVKAYLMCLYERSCKSSSQSGC